MKTQTSSRMRSRVLARFFSLLTSSLIAISIAGRVPSAQASGLSVSVPEINQKIQSQHEHWQAKSNWVSQLPKEQIQRMLGMQNPPSPDVEFIAPAGTAHRFGLDESPRPIDWRNKDGVNFVSPILNQGNCGSCVAFASVATLETQVNITSGIPNLNPSFSTQALFACGGGACEFGWMPHLASRYLTQKGVPDEACAPYTMGATGDTVSCNSICKDSDSRSLKIVNYNQPSNGTKDIESVKAALQRGPLMTAMMVYEDFISYSGGVYKHVTGGTLGGHAISIVGYEEASRSWIIRNSWGKEWGEGGFAHISWDDTSGIGNSTFQFEVPSVDGYITVKNPHGRQFLSGMQDFEVESTFNDTEKIEVTILKPNPLGLKPSVSSFSCTEKKCSFKLNTETLANDYYQIYATVTRKGGATLQSEREQFYVFNGFADLKLTYSPIDGADLTKPLKGRIVFKVQSSTGSLVPLSSIVFHVAADGKEVMTRTTDLVLPDMTIGWRTHSIGDGNYQIWFSGKLTTSKGEVAIEGARTSVTIANHGLRQFAKR